MLCILLQHLSLLCLTFPIQPSFREDLLCKPKASCSSKGWHEIDSGLLVASCINRMKETILGASISSTERRWQRERGNPGVCVAEVVEQGQAGGSAEASPRLQQASP